MGMMYDLTSNNPPPYGLTGYVDSNFAGNPTDLKSVMGYYFFLNRAVVL